MYEEITITCPSCNSQFIVSSEYCGGIVDCTECNTAFEVQAPQEKAENNMENTDTGPIELEDSTDQTKTVVISRNDIGMIPELKDVEIR